MIPSKTGIALVKGLAKIDSELISPQLRSKIENIIDKIATAQTSYKIVLDYVLGIFKEKFNNFEININKLETEFSSF